MKKLLLLAGFLGAVAGSAAYADLVLPGSNAGETDYFWQCVVVNADALGNVDQTPVTQLTSRPDYVPTEAGTLSWLSNNGQVTQGFYCGELSRAG